MGRVSSGKGIMAVIVSFGLLFSCTAELEGAAPPNSLAYQKQGRSVLPPVISLLENTYLYPEPDESVEPWAALTPQDVSTVEEDIDPSYLEADPQGKVWIKIKTTWLGDLWIHLDKEKVGILKPVDTYLALLWDARLYSEPTRSAMTEAVLSPQTVHANAVFESPFAMYSSSYRIETSWLGDQWIVANPHYLRVEVLNSELDLPTETLYMDEYDTGNRLQRPSDARFIPAQKVFAMEKTDNGVYHVRGQNGSIFWVNPQFAQPVGVKKIDETLELTKNTEQHLFPTMPFPAFGLISPQKVKAFEQWDDPQGNRWYRIHSWSGEMWIQP
ncbi:hypothetical protein GCM10023310_06010 [Paenibacillus vulneris]|uniref:SH3b domain-containing protein n=1 Tax=Paenibacillus vulneris TaxID=1133364 RepID=A0ABW3UPD7_9BACL